MKAEKKTVKKEMKTENKVVKAENIMRAPYIEKVIMSGGATKDNLAKEKKLLEIITSRKAEVVASRKRIPDFGVNPGLEVGTRVTVRGQPAMTLLGRLLGAKDNVLKARHVVENHFSFGVKEYIEIPGIEYQRDIGIRGFNVTVVFARKGLRVPRKKIKSGSLPKKQRVSKQEIIKFMEDNFKTKFE